MTHVDRNDHGDRSASTPPLDVTRGDSFVCTTCGGLSTPAGGLFAACLAPDACSCQPIPVTTSVQAAERAMSCWLCATCGLRIARGHSRWHLHHCAGCVPVVRTINRAAGRLVIPLGIHSIVNGVAGFRPGPDDDEAGSRARATAWLDQFAAMNRSSVRVNEHRRALVLHLLERCHLLHEPEVTLAELRAACVFRDIDARYGIELMLRAVLTGEDPLLDDEEVVR